MAAYTLRSITHSLLSAVATTVAARGAEYSSASSPNDAPGAYACTVRSSPHSSLCSRTPAAPRSST